MRVRGAAITIVFCVLFVPAPLAKKEAPKVLPEWVRDAIAEPFAEEFADEDAVVVLDEWDVTVERGKRTGQRRWILKVLTEDGVSEAGLTLFSGTFNRVHHVRAWLRDPNGEVELFREEDGTLLAAIDEQILDDDSVLWIEPPGLRPGSVLAVQHEFEEQADLPQDLFVIQRSEPVWRMRIALEVADDWTAYARVYGGENPGPEMVSAQGEWIFSRVPKLAGSESRHAPVPPGRRMTLDFVSPGGRPSFPDWSGTAAWVSRLYERPEGETPFLDQATARLQADDPELIARTGALVRGLRYFGVEIGWGGWRPRSPETTLRRRLGDCKDKSFLMVELLERSGVPAVPVLVIDPEDGYVYEELPGPFQFDHCIVGIPWEGRERGEGMTIVDSPGLGPLRLFDPTLGESFPRDVHPYTEGGRGLAVSTKTAGLLSIPRAPAEANLMENRIDVGVDDGGNLDVRVRRRMAGAMVSRYLYDDDGEILGGEELRETVLARWHSDYPGLRELSIDDPRPEEDGSWTYELRFVQGNALADFGELRVLRLHDMAGLSSVPLPDEDEPETVYQPYLSRRVEQWTLSIDGDRAVHLPQDLEVDNVLGRLSVRYRRENAQILVERELTLTAIAVAPERREEAQELRDALRAANAAALVLQHVPGG